MNVPFVEEPGPPQFSSVGGYEIDGRDIADRRFRGIVENKGRAGQVRWPLRDSDHVHIAGTRRNQLVDHCRQRNVHGQALGALPSDQVSVPIEEIEVGPTLEGTGIDHDRCGCESSRDRQEPEQNGAARTLIEPMASGLDPHDLGRRTTRW